MYLFTQNTLVENVESATSFVSSFDVNGLTCVSFILPQSLVYSF